MMEESDGALVKIARLQVLHAPEHVKTSLGIRARVAAKELHGSLVADAPHAGSAHIAFPQVSTQAVLK